MKLLYGLLLMTVSTQAHSLKLTASFSDGQPLPLESGWKSGNIVPRLSWNGTPEKTKSFALICDDPDAPTAQPWVHWVIFNIPTTETSLPSDAKGSVQGINSYGKQGYGGPYPPEGQTHRYYFKLYALDTLLSLPAGSTKEQLESAMKGHILATAQIMGTYARKK